MISVIIPTYNQEQDLKQNLANIVHTCYKEGISDISVIDSGSRDRTKDYVTIHYPKINYLEMPVSSYSGKQDSPENWGIRQAENNYVLVVTPEMRIIPFSTKEILSQFKKNDYFSISLAYYEQKNNLYTSWLWKNRNYIFATRSFFRA